MISVRGTGWREMSLGAVVSETGGVIQTGPFGSQLHASDYVAVGTPLVMPVNIGDNTINEHAVARVGSRDVRRLRKHIFREGDIAFSRRGDVSRRSIVRAHQTGWLCGTGCLAARFGSNLQSVNREFVALYLGLPKTRRWLEDNAVGGTMPNLNTSILAATPIRLPSRQDQDAIVVALGDIGDFITAFERLITKKQGIKQGMMQQLLTGRTRLPGFKERWTERAIGEVATVDPETLDARRGLNQVIDYISLEDARRGVLLGSTRMRFGDAPSRARRIIRATDVLFGTVRPNLQSHALYSGGLTRPIASTGFAIVRALPSAADPSYLINLLMSNHASNQIDKIIAGSNYPAVSSRDVRRLVFDFPDVREQAAIGSVLADCGAEISGLHNRLRKAQAVKQGMMQELLTGRARLPLEKGAV
jgi:type I restriction enzyme S subunit